MAEVDARKKLRQRRGADHARDVILDAAASVFAQKGYYGTTMEDVASASGDSPAAIYKYFKNKDDLFSRLWNTMAARLQEIFDESARLPMPFAMRLRWMLTRSGQLLETSPNLLVAFIAQRPYAARARSTLEEQALQHYRSHQARIVALMEQGIAEGVLREGGAPEYSLLLIGLMYEFAHRWVTDDGRMDVGQSVDSIIALFMRGQGGAGEGERAGTAGGCWIEAGGTTGGPSEASYASRHDSGRTRGRGWCLCSRAPGSAGARKRTSGGGDISFDGRKQRR